MAFAVGLAAGRMAHLQFFESDSGRTTYSVVQRNRNKTPSQSITLADEDEVDDEEHEDACHG